MKQGGREDICSACHANLTLGEVHDVDCDRAPKEWEDGDDDEDGEEDEEEDW
jgi:hypothetical protein